jgi:hypothetical protein
MKNKRKRNKMESKPERTRRGSISCRDSAYDKSARSCGSKNRYGIEDRNVDRSNDPVSQCMFGIMSD